MSEKNNIQYRLAFLGESTVGKTSIFKKISFGTFTESVASIGINQKSINFPDLEVTINGNQLKKSFEIVLFDTAGQERFRSITKNHIRGSDGIILVYDITNKKTFNKLEEWLQTIKDILSDWRNSNFLILLLGNKLDLVNDENETRQVQTEEGEQLCEDKEIIWGGECSAKDFTNTQFFDIFKDFTKQLFNKIGDNKKNNLDLKKTKKKKCC